MIIDSAIRIIHTIIQNQQLPGALMTNLAGVQFIGGSRNEKPRIFPGPLLAVWMICV